MSKTSPRRDIALANLPDSFYDEFLLRRHSSVTMPSGEGWDQERGLITSVDTDYSTAYEAEVSWVRQQQGLVSSPGEGTPGLMSSGLLPVGFMPCLDDELDPPAATPVMHAFGAPNYRGMNYVSDGPPIFSRFAEPPPLASTTRQTPEAPCPHLAVAAPRPPVRPQNGLAQVEPRASMGEDVDPGAAKPKRSLGGTLVDTIREDGAQTFLVQQLPRTTTTDEVIQELDQLGCGNFELFRMPVSNHDALIRGFAVINYSRVEEAVRFVTMIEGRVFAGGSERAVIEIAGKQGVMENLAHLGTANRRRRRITHVCGKKGVQNGCPLVRLNGQLRQMVSDEDVEEARAVYGYSR